MKMMNRISRRMMNKAVTVAGAACLTLLTAAADPTSAQVASPATQPAMATTRPANHLIADGVGDDGRVHMTVNKTVVLTTTQPYKQVSVGQPDIADVNMISPNSILVTAKKTGSTQLIVWDDQNHSQVADIVVNMDLEALQAELGTMFPGTKITAKSMNGAIALTGMVPDLEAAQQATAITQPYTQKVINLLTVGGGQQVMLQVRFAEVSRKATNELAVNFGISDGTSFFGSNIGQTSPFGVTGGAPPALGVPSPGTGVTLFGAA